MLVVESENIVMIDVDDTLVMHDKKKSGDIVEIVDPYKENHVYKLRPHKKHISLLIDYKARGKTIIVWSHGGWLWAKTVIETLKLEKYVDFVMSKPKTYVDDLTTDCILTNRVYLKED